MPDNLTPPMSIPPGVMANGSEYEAEGRWRVANQIRWYNGKLRPIGGWQRFTKTPLAAPARALLSWRDLIGIPRAAAGTASNLYYSDGALITDITPSGLAEGHVDGGGGTGWGVGDYSAETYGTPRTEGALAEECTTWALDNFGQILLAVATGDGKLYMWDAATEPAKATVVSTAPTENTSMFVTDERMVVLLGAGGNPREVQWSNQDDYTNWTPTAATTAGDLQLHSNGVVKSGTRMPGMNLIWTDVDVHQMTYVGYPLIYGIQRIGVGCGLIAPKAFASTQAFCMWMSQGQFFLYNGIVQPMPSDVAEAVFDNINQQQVSKICGGHNSQFSEVWFFFPSLGSNENDSYVFYNYKDNHWGFGLGAFGRSAWADKDVWPYPIAGDGAGLLYEQENGWTAAGTTRVGSVNATSGLFDIQNGSKTFDVQQILTDTNKGPGQYALSFITKMNPNDPDPQTYGPFPMRDDGYTDARFSGRQAQMQVDLLVDGLFQLGQMRLELSPAGSR